MQKAESEGLKIKVGRWNIPCQPVVVLIDFTPSFSQKDKIFAWLWETYKLNSLPGGWDLGVMTEYDYIRNGDNSGYHSEFINSVTISHDIAGKLVKTLREGDGVAIDILRQMGVSPEQIRRETQKALQEAPVAAEKPATAAAKSVAALAPDSFRSNVSCKILNTFSSLD